MVYRMWEKKADENYLEKEKYTVAVVVEQRSRLLRRYKDRYIQQFLRFQPKSITDLL